MAPRYRNRTAAVNDEQQIRDEWFTVETSEGNAIGGLDGVFDWDSEDEALHVLRNLVVESGKVLTVVGYTRTQLGSYGAVTKVEKID